MSMGTLPAEILSAASEHDTAKCIFSSAVRPVNATVGALVSDAERVAGALQGRGIGRGDVVAVQLPNWYEGAVAQAAVMLCGATLVPIVDTYGPREIGFILRQSGASAVFVPGTWRRRNYPALIASIGDLPALRTVIVVDDDGPAPADTLRFSDLTARFARPYAAPTGIAPGDRATLIFTSGTTAAPKGVQHSHASVLAEMTSPVMLRSRDPEARYLALFPGGHVAGLLGLLRMLLHGGLTVHLDRWGSARAARMVDEHELTRTSAAPIHLTGLLDERERGTATLNSLREVLTGAAGVPPALIRRADDAGILAYRTYGSSEHPTISSGLPEDSLAKRATTDGRVIEGNEIRLVDPAGQDVSDGTPGEIVSRGGELFSGYSDQTLDVEAFLPGRWYRTGDVGRIDQDGYLTITGRIKDIIIRGGEKISAKEIEDILAQHPKIVEAAVIGAPDERYGERVCAVVVTRGGAELDLEEVGTLFASVGAARQKTPEEIVVVDELPRTASGKVQKYLLRTQVGGVRNEQ